MRVLVAVFTMAAVAISLQGCGSSSKSSTTVTTTATAKETTTQGTTVTTTQGTTVTTTQGTTVTTTSGIRVKPMTSKEAADYLNKLYLGYSEEDPTTPVGVTLSMAGQPDGFFKNIYCSKFWNPAAPDGHTSCFKGQADCRMSTSVIGKGWMVDNTTKALAMYGGRAVGFIFNQTMVEQKWTKCSYIWDGASFRLYNRGCGDGAKSDVCGPNEENAFNNKCGDHTCTAADDQIKRKICKGAGGDAPVPERHDTQPECMFPGAAFDYHGQADYTPWKDYTREMIKQRLKYNDGSDSEGPNVQKNNEVVLDEELLLQDIMQDPVKAIPAIVYSKKVGITKYANDIRDDLCKHYGCANNPIPIVMMDDVSYQPNGPFFPATEEDFSIAI